MNVIICTYNNASFLDQALTALEKQRFPSSRDWSVLVVDNNCTDSTANIVAQHIANSKIPQLQRIVEDKQGLAYARLCGIQNTSDDWIAFVDDDCLLAPDWVEQASKFAESHPQCGAFGGKVILEWEQPPSPILLKHKRVFAAYSRGEEEKQLSREDFHIPGAGLIINRMAIKESGWIEKQYFTGRNGSQLTAGDDSEIVLRILNADYELWYTPECTLKHKIQARRISESYLSKLSYGLGLAAPYLAILQWRHSYWYWLAFSMLRVMKYLLVTLAYATFAIWNVNQRKSLRVEWNWTKGQIDTLFYLLVASKQERMIWLNLFE